MCSLLSLCQVLTLRICDDGDRIGWEQADSSVLRQTDSISELPAGLNLFPCKNICHNHVFLIFKTNLISDIISFRAEASFAAVCSCVLQTGTILILY